MDEITKESLRPCFTKNVASQNQNMTNKARDMRVFLNCCPND